MLATLTLKELLSGKEFSEISEIYVNNLPKEIQENTDKTIMLLRESGAFLDMFGNDSFFGKTNQIEVQIFYKLDDGGLLCCSRKNNLIKRRKIWQLSV